MSDRSVAHRLKKPLTIDTAAVRPDPSAVKLSEAGSLHGTDISVSMSGLRISSSSVDEVGSTAAPSSSEQVGLSSFDVLQELGEGSSGVVKLVKHKPTGEFFAMKVITIGCTEEERTRILFEARTLHASHVPGIIAFRDAFYAEGAVHMVLEYMECGSLADCIAQRGPLPEALLAVVARTVVGGIEHLHQHLRILHRDIKPSNILLNGKGQAKLADFGMSGQLASTFSRLASWVGTAAYMSPERISGDAYSYSADVWSLGVSMWECGMGRYPYGRASSSGDGAVDLGGGPEPHPDALAGGDDGYGVGGLPEVRGIGMCFWELLHQIVEGDPPQLPPGRFSVELCAFVHHCMRKPSNERPTSAELLRYRWLCLEDTGGDVDVHAMVHAWLHGLQ